MKLYRILAAVWLILLIATLLLFLFAPRGYWLSTFSLVCSLVGKLIVLRRKLGLTQS